MSRVRKFAEAIRRCGHRVALVAVVTSAALWFAPIAFAHSHVGFGISIGVGNCWRCGYRSAPPVVYAPAYPPRVYYYPRTVYYAPPAYYGYRYGYYGRFRHRGYWSRGGYSYQRGHHEYGGRQHDHGHYYRGHR